MCLVCLLYFVADQSPKKTHTHAHTHTEQIPRPKKQHTNPCMCSAPVRMLRAIVIEMRSRIFLEPMCRMQTEFGACVWVCVFCGRSQRVQSRVCGARQVRRRRSSRRCRRRRHRSVSPHSDSDLEGGENIEILSCSTRSDTWRQ